MSSSTIALSNPLFDVSLPIGSVISSIELIGGTTLSCGNTISTDASLNSITFLSLSSNLSNILNPT
ncbi:MAG: hypothetical protein ACI4WW_05040 [Candidatus Coprovivens sp.]